MFRRFFRHPAPIRLGRWATNTSPQVAQKRAEMADHDSCGARDCATPVHLADIDEDTDWYARFYYDSVKKSKMDRRK